MPEPLRTERTLATIRLVGALFALVQVITFYRPYPPGVLPIALVLVGALAAGNLVIWLLARRPLDVGAARALAVAALVFEALIVSGFVFVYTFDPDTAIWALIYILPLLGAIRFQLIGAAAVMAGATVVYALREVYGSMTYGHEFLLTSISFRMGIGFIIASVAGSMASNLVKQRNEVEREKKHSEGIIVSSKDGILAFDRKCRYTVWNPAMEEISGRVRGDVLGKVAFELFPFLEEIGEDSFFHDALRGQSGVALERPFSVLETGRHGFFEAYYSPQYGDSGEIVGGLAIVRDITERKTAEELRRRLEDAERRRHEALQLNDNVVQGLAAAKMALELGAQDKLEELLTGTLKKARRLVSQLMEETDGGEWRVRPGDLTRSEAANISDTPE